MIALTKHINDVADARANINVFYSLIGALENGTISGASASKTSDKIIKLCKDEARKQLMAMDAAIEAAHGITSGEAMTKGNT